MRHLRKQEVKKEKKEEKERKKERKKVKKREKESKKIKKGKKKKERKEKERKKKNEKEKEEKEEKGGGKEMCDTCSCKSTDVVAQQRKRGKTVVLLQCGGQELFCTGRKKERERIRRRTNSRNVKKATARPGYKETLCLRV